MTTLTATLPTLREALDQMYVQRRELEGELRKLTNLIEKLEQTEDKLQAR